MENKQNILRLILSYKQCLILEYYTLRGLKCVFYTINEIKDWEGGNQDFPFNLHLEEILSSWIFISIDNKWISGNRAKKKLQIRQFLFFLL